MDRCKRHKYGPPSGFRNYINGHKAYRQATSRTCKICGFVAWYDLSTGRKVE